MLRMIQPIGSKPKAAPKQGGLAGHLHRHAKDERCGGERDGEPEKRRHMRLDAKDSERSQEDNDG